MVSKHRRLRTEFLLVLAAIVASAAPGAQAGDEAGADGHVGTDGARVQRTLSLNLGIEQMAEGDFDQAESTFVQLINTSQQQDAPAEELQTYYYYLAVAQIRRADAWPAGSAEAIAKYAQAADNLARALEDIEPGTPEYESLSSAHLDRGLALLRAREPSEAARSLRAFLSDLPNDAGRMLLGVADYRSGDYKRTIEDLAPLAADESSPFTDYASFYMGLAHARRLDKTGARDQLGRVIQRDPEGELGQTAQRVLQQLEEVETVSPLAWGMRFELGNMYDTNVSLLGDDTSPAIPVDHKDDYRFALQSEFWADYQPNEGPLKDWHFNVGARIYDSWHPSLGEYNVQNYAMNLYVGRKLYADRDAFLSFSEIGLRYDYDYALVGNDGFLSRNSLMAMIYLEELAGRGRTYIEGGDQYREYEEWLYNTSFDRDGNYWTIALLQEFDVAEVPDAWRYSFEDTMPRWVTVRLGYRHDNNSTIGDEFDFDANTLIAGVDVPLPWNMEFGFNSEFEWQNYWQNSQIDYRRRQRDDFIQRYMFSLGRRFNEWFELVAHISWTNDDSNVKNRLGGAVFSYDRVIYGLTARITFDDRMLSQAN